MSVLIKYAKKIDKADIKAYIRRTMWASLDERVSIAYQKYFSQSGNTIPYGGFNKYSSNCNEPIRSSKLVSSQYINAIHITAGRRRLGVHSVVDGVLSRGQACEYNAQLWYGQSPSGQVLVFVAPYESDLGKINEEQIIIGKYKEPASIACSEIEKHFDIFCRYCYCTSQHSAGNLGNYAYRKLMMARDFRYKNNIRSKILNIAERLGVIIIGLAAIWASLYAGGKI